jgi:hypothetical protein
LVVWRCSTTPVRGIWWKLNPFSRRECDGIWGSLRSEKPT